MIRGRWLVGTAAMALVLVSAWVTVGRAQPAPPVLTQVSPQQLISNVLRVAQSPPSFSGTATSHLDLGFPAPPANLGGADGPLSVLLQDQTFRVWSSPDGIRVAEMLPFGERDMIANATDAWAWDSTTSTAVHFARPAPGSPTGSAPESPAPTMGDPASVATTILEKVRPYAEVSVSTSAWVAGEPTYTLVLTPSSPWTLVGHVDISVDADSWVPLQLQIYPRSSDTPAIQLGFTGVDFAHVDRSMFSFSPPAGTKVEQASASGSSQTDVSPGTSAQPGSDLKVLGTGFETVVAVRVSQVPKGAGAYLPYSGPLGSATVVDRGDHAWVLAGLVPQSTLVAAEPQLP